VDGEFLTLVSYCLFNGIIKRHTATAGGGVSRWSTSQRRVMSQRLGASILELNGEITVILLGFKLGAVHCDLVVALCVLVVFRVNAWKMEVSVCMQLYRFKKHGTGTTLETKLVEGAGSV